MAAEGSAGSVGVIYVTWNSREILGRTLTSLLGGERAFELHVAVVDNASADGTAQWVKEQFPGVALRVNEANEGFAVAVNQGARIVRGNYLLVLNPDTVITTATIARMVEFLEACPTVGACGPVTVDDEGLPNANAVAFPPLSRRLDPLLRTHPHGAPLELPPGPWGTVTRAHWLTGACLMIRRETFVATGGMDEGYFMYWEDVDWCYRCLHAGWEVALLADLRALHPGGHSARQIARPLTLYRMHDSYFRFLTCAHGKLVARANFVQWFFNAGVKWLVLAPLSRFVPRLQTRVLFEGSRLRFCLANCGTPFWRCRFGRNYAPEGTRTAS